MNSKKTNLAKVVYLFQTELIVTPEPSLASYCNGVSDKESDEENLKQLDREIAMKIVNEFRTMKIYIPTDKELNHYFKRKNSIHKLVREEFKISQN